VFYPLYYYAIELLDKYIPDPLSVREDVNEGKQAGNSSPEPPRFDSSGAAPPQTNFDFENNTRWR
ncbi:MAG: hypothetical protein QW594_03180, partial [Candidatus Woesearchaeota archaeon]